MSIKEQKVNQLHDEAMKWTDEAYLAKRAKNLAEAKSYYKKAFDLEKEAAMLLVMN